MWRDTVSIVIPCFNHQRFVGAAIDSALRQRWPACEVIVIDDGSTDASAAVIARYSSVITFLRQPNAGLSASRNRGLRASRGEFVIFLDADDRLWPEAASNAVAAFTSHSDATMVFGRCRLIDQAGQPLPTNARPVRSRFYEELLRGNFIWMPAMAAFRRRVFDAVGTFDHRLNPAGDYDMYCRIARQHGIAAHDAVVADYRQHDGNMSADPILMLDSTLRVLRAQRPYVRVSSALAAAYADGEVNWRTFYGERLVQRFRGNLRARRWRSAFTDAMHLLRWYPRGVRYHVLKKLRLTLSGSSDVSRGDRLSDLAGL